MSPVDPAAAVAARHRRRSRRESPAFKTFTGPALGAEITWTREWRAAGIGGAGGQGNARSAALLNAVIAGRGEVGGVRVLSPETVDRIFADSIDGVDYVLGIPLRWGLGFGLRHPDSTNYIPEGRIAFWGGWGGSLVTADVDRDVTFAYVMNRMSDGILASARARGVPERDLRRALTSERMPHPARHAAPVSPGPGGAADAAAALARRR